MNSTLLNKLFSTVFERPSLYNLNDSSRAAIMEACGNFLFAILKNNPEYTERFVQKAIDKLAWMENAMFINVSPLKATPLDFKEKYDHHWQKTQHNTAVHLEIGTWTAWPDDKVDEYIKNENIGDFIRLDMDHSFKPDIAASATAIPLKDHSVDRVSSNSLFEHVAYPHDILREVFRILKPGGVFYTAVPFHFVQHDCPSDYLRYTGAFFKDVCADLGFSEVYLDVKSASGVYYTIHNLAKAAIVEATLPERERTIAQQFHASLLILLTALQSIDDDFLAYGASHWHTTHVIAIKKGEYSKRPDPIDRKKPFVERWERFLISPDNGKQLLIKENELIVEDGDGLLKYPIIEGIPVLLPKVNFSSSILKS